MPIFYLSILLQDRMKENEDTTKVPHFECCKGSILHTAVSDTHIHSRRGGH